MENAERAVRGGGRRKGWEENFFKKGTKLYHTHSQNGCMMHVLQAMETPHSKQPAESEKVSPTTLSTED